MTAKRIDGKEFAAGLRARIGEATRKVTDAHGLVPGLTVILVGNDPASEVYVRNKGMAARELGFASHQIDMPAETTEAELLAEVEKLNQDPAVHGILVQFPVPDHISQDKVIDAIAPEKDVDGLHPINAGRLAAGQEALVSCTPFGCLLLLRDQFPEGMSGKNAVIVGRSRLVGKPMAQLLLGENCTVTIAHSRTQDLAGVCREADILVAAVGRPQMVKGDWVKPGATVIDVGINRIDLEGGKTRLVGDVDYEGAVEIAGAITPVPGGVGPMTIAVLMANTLIAACRQKGIEAPEF